MSHIHLPDGIIPLIWWLGGFIAAVLLAFVVLKKIDTDGIRRKIPLAAVMAAVMLITMSVPLGFIPFHLNMSSLAGIMMGPGLGFIIAFVVNIFMALMGHGGVTVIGLNTLIIGSEAVLAFSFFSLLKKTFSKPLAIGVSVFLALVISISMMLAVVGFSGAIDISGGEAFIEKDHDEKTHQEEPHAEEEYAEETHEEEHKEGFSLGFITLTGWAAFLTVVFLGIILEAVLSAVIVKFIEKIRPGLFEPLPGN